MQHNLSLTFFFHFSVSVDVSLSKFLCIDVHLRTLSSALGRMSSIRDRRPISALSTRYPDSPVMTRQNGTIDVSGLGEIGTQGLYKATLYVLGEKTQMKVSVCFCLNQMQILMEIHARQ